MFSGAIKSDWGTVLVDGSAISPKAVATLSDKLSPEMVKQMSSFIEANPGLYFLVVRMPAVGTVLETINIEAPCVNGLSTPPNGQAGLNAYRAGGFNASRVDTVSIGGEPRDVFQLVASSL